MKKRSLKRILKWIALGLLATLLILIVVFLGFYVYGRQALLGKTDSSVQITAPELEEVRVEDDGDVIYYKGEKYLFNENVTSILCMGVDKEEIAQDDTVIGNGGQADMLMLVILDTKSGKVKLWNISRDAMTDVDIYNVDEEYVRTETKQVCLAYAYGDGGESSCENTVRSVSRLLYGMPIQSYLVLDMDAIQPLNDAVGGVEVTIHEGDILPEKFKPGTKVLLKGKDVISYVRSRRTERTDEPIDTNNNRMARQKQYMTNFIYKALQMTKQDLTTPIELYNIAKEDDHMITNLSVSKITYLTTLFAKVDFSEESFRTVPGTVQAGKKHAEFYVDDEALYEMILDTFYIKQ